MSGLSAPVYSLHKNFAKKMRVYRNAICAPCGDDLSPGKGVENEAVLRKNYQALSFSYQVLSFSYKVLSLQCIAVRQSFLEPKEIAHRELPCQPFRSFRAGKTKTEINPLCWMQCLLRAMDAVSV